MDFKKFQPKLSEITDKNKLPSSQFQKRLENLLKSTNFNHSTSHLSRNNLEKLNKSLIPVITLYKTVKLSAFKALFSSNCEFVDETREISSKIARISRKRGFSQQISEEIASNVKLLKLIKLFRVFLRADAKLSNFSLISEKTRDFFQKWRLICFESGLRNLLIFQSELINKQIICQFENVFLAVFRPILAFSLEKIRKSAKKNEFFPINLKAQKKKADFQLAVMILSGVFKEKTTFSLSLPFFKLKRYSFRRKAGKSTLKSAKIGLFILAKCWKLRKKQRFFEFFSKLRAILPANREFPQKTEATRNFSLQRVCKAAKLREIALKKFGFERLFYDFLEKKSRVRVFWHVSKKQAAKVLNFYFRKWEFAAWKIADPLIRTRKNSERKSSAIPSKNRESIAINRKVMINQAMVNKELEEEQRKKALKLLNLNQNLGLIEISILISRKQRLYAKIFFSNFQILGTFEPRRYQEFEDYSKILQEEKEILLNELEEISNYNKKFAKQLDQKICSIWGVSSTGPSAITEENINNNGNNNGNSNKSGPDLMEFNNNLLNEENDEGQINLNYLEFLEDRNVELQEEVEKNEQRIKYEEEKYETELNNLKEKIRKLQAGETKSHFPANTTVTNPVNKAKKPKNASKLSDKKLPEKKYSMLRSINSLFQKKSYTHDQEETE